MVQVGSDLRLEGSSDWLDSKVEQALGRIRFALGPRKVRIVTGMRELSRENRRPNACGLLVPACSVMRR